MANPTSNFGWQMPTPVDLVTDLPADFEVFGQAVDSSLADLKGGTSGQVLSKNSNTDMDFVWVTSDDANAIQNTIVDAKGDLIGATAADTPARLAVGTNGQVLTADSTAATGLAWATPSGGSNTFFAGKNKIINGDFRIWQRGTSFTTNGGYTADRFIAYHDGTVSTTISQQAFTAGTAPVAGYEGQFFIRKATTSQSGGTYNTIQQPIESVRNFAGQQITVSFWAKAAASQNITVNVNQEFGNTGSPSATVTNNSGNIALTTSWARYSYTLTLGSLTGKTITTNDVLVIAFNMPLNTASTIDIWGVQVEAGSTATDFQTATGTIQGELAACQRYYQRIGGNSAYEAVVVGIGASSTLARFLVPLKVTMRVAPTSVETNAIAVWDTATVVSATGATLSTAENGPNFLSIFTSHASGITQFRPYFLLMNNSTSAFLGINAEL
jgi:hypothetical protein